MFINPVYLGDYDSVASDFQLTGAGFLGAYGVINAGAAVPNQDVALFRFP